MFLYSIPVGMLYKKLRREKTVRFHDAVFLRVDIQPSKIEIFFLDLSEAYFKTLIYWLLLQVYYKIIITRENVSW